MSAQTHILFNPFLCHTSTYADSHYYILIVSFYYILPYIYSLFCACFTFRLCSLTITRLSILTPLPGDMTSLSLAVKMQSSKRTLRSHEIPISSSGLLQSASNATAAYNLLQQQREQREREQQGNSPVTGVGQMNSISSVVGGISGGHCNNLNLHGGTGQIGTTSNAGGNIGITAAGVGSTTGNIPLSETELDLHFSLQYPHFIKRDGNR